jgi:hypothetical protein
LQEGLDFNEGACLPLDFVKVDSINLLGNDCKETHLRAPQDASEVLESLHSGNHDWDTFEVIKIEGAVRAYADFAAFHWALVASVLATKDFDKC